MELKKKKKRKGEEDVGGKKNVKREEKYEKIDILGNDQNN